MLRKSLFTFLFILSAISFSFGQEIEPAMSSKLTSTSLPANASRLSPESVPADISNTLEKLVAAGEGTLRQGDSEVLVWNGKEYEKVGKTTTVNRLMDTMKVAGWKYEVTAEENGVTFFALVRETPKRQGLIGFYAESDATLVLAWTEVLPNGNQSEKTEQVEKIESVSAGKNEIAGTWDNGRVSTINRQNTVTGAITPGSGTRFEYQFTANGKFYFTGLATTTNYSCTDTLFNEKAGSYTLNGSTLTLNPTKNFWRKTSTCGAGSERNYTLAKEVYQFSTKTNEYGQELICLTNSSGESCYRRKK